MSDRIKSISANLEAAAGELAVPPDSVTSLKFRAVSEPEGSRWYPFSPAMYGELKGRINLPFASARYNGRAFREGRQILVEHESGPEIIVELAKQGVELAGGLVTVVETVKLAVKLVDWIREKVNVWHPRSDHPGGGRLLRVERRRFALTGELVEEIQVVIDLDQPTDEDALTRISSAALGYA